MKYGYSRKVKLGFDDAVAKVTDELQKVGFGILTEINVKETFKKKLDVDFKPYIILGACNPPSAYKALSAEEEIGLLLPCNVIVYENDNGESVVAAVEVDAMLSLVENPDIEELAKEIKNKLHIAIDSV